MSEPKLAMGPDAAIWATVPLEGSVRCYEQTGEMRAELRSALTLTGDRVELNRPLGIARDATRELMVITDLDRVLILPDTERK